MTTQQMPYEQSDVDATVVEYPSAPEAAVPSTAAEKLSPLEQEAQAEVSSVAETTHVESERQNETPVVQGEGAMEPTPAIPGILSFAIPSLHIPVPDTVETTKTEPVREEPVSASAPAEPAATSAEEQAAFTFTEENHLFGGAQEGVRPFTAFIEEFRQAEARLNASLQESEDAFSLLTSLPPVSSDVDTMYSAPMESDVLGTVIAPTEESQAPSAELPGAEDIEMPSPSVPSSQEQPASVPVQEADETAEAIAPATLSTPQPAAPPSAQPAAERPVSPLLRPATRLRLPRHGSIRQREEEVALETPQIASGVPSAAQPAPVPTATVTELEQPKPARRYRFDRPIASSTPTASGGLPSAVSAPSTLSTPTSPSSQQRAEENREKEQPGRSGPTTAARSENGQSSSGAATEIPPKQGTNGSPSLLEQQPAKQAVQERQQEQPPVAAPTSQAVPPTPPVTLPIAAEPGTGTPMLEPAAQQAEEIAPEDLPPLEYSELQKASSRRRRRHRAGSNSGSAGTAAANTQATASSVKDALATPQPAAPLGATPPVPAAPSTSKAANNTTPTPQFNIVSGYTLNQMNQGNDPNGPFMGPEPSPARGSASTRDGRTTRAETQRSPVYAVRTPDVAPSVTSIQQLASVLSQAIQTQTDRMVAELRRANQVPTNISVALPPFPSTERVGVFVDVANLLYSARTMRISIDFGKLLDFLRGNRRLVRAHAYCPTSPQPGDEQMFLQAVKGLGYRITTKNYKTFSSGAKKADLDLDLCMDVVRLVEGKAIDCVVLVSGDSDFMPMLDYCSDHGVRVEVAAFDEAMSATLRQSCDLFINLSMLEEVRL